MAGRGLAALRANIVPILMKHSADSCAAIPNSCRKPCALRALPLVRADPKPIAVAISNMFCMAHPAETIRSGKSMSGSPIPPLTMASSSKGARKAFSRACASWSSRADGSRSSNACANASASVARASDGTSTNRQGKSWPWSGAEAAAFSMRSSSIASGPGAIRRLGRMVWREWIRSAARETTSFMGGMVS